MDALLFALGFLAFLLLVGYLVHRADRRHQEQWLREHKEELVAAIVDNMAGERKRLEQQLQDINAALERSDSIAKQAIEALQHDERKGTK